MWIPSWTDVTCIFKELLRHVSHWKGLFPSWTEATCFFSIHLLENICDPKCHILIPFFLYAPMLHDIQGTPCCIALTTNVTFEWLLSFMNWSSVQYHVANCCEISMANSTFEFLSSFLHWCDMYFQGALFGIAFDTYLTFKGLFSSWNETTCFFKSFFWEHLWSQMSHLNSFFLFHAPKCYMNMQGTLCWIALATNVTRKWLLSFMNCSNAHVVSFGLFENSCSHNFFNNFLILFLFHRPQIIYKKSSKN